MEIVTIELDDYKAVEKSHLNRWRVHNGETWAHGFHTLERAIEFAKRAGGTFVGRCEEIDGEIGYTRVIEV